MARVEILESGSRAHLSVKTAAIMQIGSWDGRGRKGVAFGTTEVRPSLLFSSFPK